MTDENIYYGVTVPFSDKERAYRVAREISKILGYGCWVREGNYNEDD